MNSSQKCFLWIAKACNPHTKAFTSTESCSGGVYTHSKVFMHTQSHSGGCSNSLKGMYVHSGAVHTNSKAFMGTRLHSGAVHTHSKAFTCIQWAFKGYSIVCNTHWRIFSPQLPNRYALKMQSTQRLYRLALHFSWMLSYIHYASIVQIC